MARLWEIWCERFRATGEHGTAHLLGTEEAETFRDAVQKLTNKQPDLAKNMNVKGLMFWGCHLFDNEADARKAFG